MKANIREALDRYVSHHCPTGDFLYAVLCNDLRESFWRADEENMADLYDIVSYCYNEIPSTCCGSKEKVELWLSTPV